MYEKRIQIRWRDLDARAEVGNRVLFVYFDEGRDEWLTDLLVPGAAIWDYVTARIALERRGSLRLEHREAICRTSVSRFGRSSVTLRQVVERPDGVVVAEGESVLVAWDPEAMRSRPLTESERAALEREVAAE